MKKCFSFPENRRHASSLILHGMTHPAFCSQKRWEQSVFRILSNLLARYDRNRKECRRDGQGQGKNHIVEIKANISSDSPPGAFGLHGILFDFMLHHFERGGAAGNPRRALCRQPGLRGLPRGNCPGISRQPARALAYQGCGHDRPGRLRILPRTRQ